MKTIRRGKVASPETPYHLLQFSNGIARNLYGNGPRQKKKEKKRTTHQKPGFCQKKKEKKNNVQTQLQQAIREQ